MPIKRERQVDSDIICVRVRGVLVGPPRPCDVGVYKVSHLAGNILNADTTSPRGKLPVAPWGRSRVLP